MNILKDIIEWVKDKPTFWQIAIDRLIRNSHLTQLDLDELEGICKVNVGLSKHTYTPVDFKNLLLFANNSVTNKSLILNRIYDIENINALASGNVLEFALNGLTVVYGDNGAGKSSYVSILKHACNTRGQKPLISNNIFDSKSAGKDNKAKIEYTIDKTKFDFAELINEQVKNSTLRSVNVFDANSANHYIEGEDEIAFIPQGLSILEKFAIAIKHIESEVQKQIDHTEISKLNFSFLQLSPNTKAQIFINSVSYKTKLDQLRKVSNNTNAKNTRVLELKKLIPKLKATDPKQKIKSYSDKIQRYKVIEQKLNNIGNLFSEIALEKIITSINSYALASNALKATTDKIFAELPIEGVGNDTWKSLWESARGFFEDNKGIDSFPEVGEDSSCPLCLQPLDLDAKNRFKEFEKFVKNDSQKKYDDSLVQYNKVVHAIENISFDFIEQTPIIEELEESIEGFKNIFDEYIKILGDYKNELLSILSKKQKLDKIQSIEIKVNANEFISKQIKELNDAIEKLRTQSIEKELKPIEIELSELLDEKKLYDFKPKVAREIYRQKRIKLLNDCKKKCSTRTLTALSNQLTSKYISQNLKNSFKSELKNLGFRNIKIEAETKGKKGKQYHYLRLDEAISNKATLKDILSEGEHRCISLATFFSELSIADHNSSIIFDDPVSSLDHKWRNKISKRIAQESLKRQVIVFTHDITFLQMIQEASKEFNCDLKIQSLTRTKTETGLIASNPPWDALSVGKRIGLLKNAYQNLEKTERTETEEIYKERAKTLYGKLRETWERFIEEVFLNGVIQRFGRTIQTQRLSKVVDLTADDYNLVDSNMGKCSTFFTGHDTAGTLIEEMPDSAEFLADVIILEEYIKAVRKRRK